MRAPERDRKILLTGRTWLALVASVTSGSGKISYMMINDAANSTADGIDYLLQPWQQLAVQLSPLIGDSGFCALYGRAARLASQQFGWLVPIPSRTSITALLAGLRVLLAQAGYAEASLANTVLITTFTRLLTGLIGGALTTQILDAAPAGGSAFQPVQEQK